MSESPVLDDSGGAHASVSWPSARRTISIATAVSIVVTVASYVLQGDFANLVVASAFLGATWWLVLGGDTRTIRAYGLSLGGVAEPEPLEGARVARALGAALAWASCLALVTFPPFIAGYAKLWASTRSFTWNVPAAEWLDRVAGQVLVVALPEEAFFRGYLQSALDGRWGARWRLLGAELGPGWLVSAAIFALGHFATIPQPGRLAVFFPALAFGWLRARTGGIGAGIAYHAACNLLSTGLALGFGLRAR